MNFKNITEFSLPILFKFNDFENVNLIFVYKNYFICESTILSLSFGTMSWLWDLDAWKDTNPYWLPACDQASRWEIF